MGFFDEAQEMLDRGVAVAKGAVSGVAVEQQAFVKSFVRMCTQGCELGWHEANGGNATYRLTAEDVSSSKSFFYDTPSSWVIFEEAAPSLAHEYFLVTGAGVFMRNVSLDPDATLGIVELNDDGSAWRIVWGFKNGGVPTSELASHVLSHASRAAASGGATRVLYHVHPVNTIALSAVMPLDSRTVTRALWKAMTECVMVFPEGIGVVEWMVPGSTELAKATTAYMKEYPACLWAQHGLFVSGASFDAAFGLAHTIEKAAEIYRLAQAMSVAGATSLNVISDEGLRAIAKAYQLPLNENFLD